PYTRCAGTGGHYAAVGHGDVGATIYIGPERFVAECRYLQAVRRGDRRRRTLRKHPIGAATVGGDGSPLQVECPGADAGGIGEGEGAPALVAECLHPVCRTVDRRLDPLS